jgi:hypothetical protein
MGTHYFQIQLRVGIPQVDAAAGRLLCLETTLYAPRANGPRAPLASANGVRTTSAAICKMTATGGQRRRGACDRRAGGQTLTGDPVPEWVSHRTSAPAPGRASLITRLEPRPAPPVSGHRAGPRPGRRAGNFAGRADD